MLTGSNIFAVLGMILATAQSALLRVNLVVRLAASFAD